jgi:hypothetical protein
MYIRRTPPFEINLAKPIARTLMLAELKKPSPKSNRVLLDRAFENNSIGVWSRPEEYVYVKL